jgi:phage-related protein
LSSKLIAIYLFFDIIIMNTWSVETLNELVDAELTALPLDMRGRFVRVSQMIEEFGPFKVGMPHIKSLDNKLWEIRVSGRDGIARGIYVVTSGKRVLVVHVFIKKTQQTPAKALQTATKRAKEAGLL